MKPEKILYKNQKEVQDKIVRELKAKYLRNIKEAYLIGSLVNDNFGVYKEAYEEGFGSDIDVVVIPIKILKKWRYEGEFYGWHSKYRVGEIKIKQTTHPISLMIPLNKDIRLFFQKAKELNWKVERLK